MVQNYTFSAGQRYLIKTRGGGKFSINLVYIHDDILMPNPCKFFLLS